MFGGQVGYNGTINDNTTFIVGAGYYYIPVEGSLNANQMIDSDNSKNGFGNSLVGDMYAMDYKVAEVFAEVNTKLAGVPATFFADFVQNTESDADEDTGYAVGFKLGKAKGRGDIEFGYMYEDLEADAVYAAFTDSDFGGGGTDVKGHKLSAAIGLSKNTKLGITYFDNEYGDFTRGEEFDYDRVQVDLATKF